MMDNNNNILQLFYIGFLGLICVGSPLNASYSLISECNNAGLGNYCDNNKIIFYGCLFWIAGTVCILNLILFDKLIYLFYI